MMPYTEPEYSTMVPLEIEEMTGSKTRLLPTFRHVLAADGGRLIQAIVSELGAKIGMLERSPQFDLDGELFTGPGEQNADWFHQVWSRPDNQQYAIDFAFPPTDEEYTFIIPTVAFGAFGRYDPFSSSRFSQSAEFARDVAWTIGNRNRSPWIIVPLKSRRFLPFLFVSQDAHVIQVVTRVILELAPAALLSVWNGPETAPVERA